VRLNKQQKMIRIEIVLLNIKRKKYAYLFQPKGLVFYENCPILSQPGTSWDKLFVENKGFSSCPTCPTVPQKIGDQRSVVRNLKDHGGCLKSRFSVSYSVVKGFKPQNSQKRETQTKIETYRSNLAFQTSSFDSLPTNRSL